MGVFPVFGLKGKGRGTVCPVLSIRLLQTLHHSNLESGSARPRGRGIRAEPHPLSRVLSPAASRTHSHQRAAPHTQPNSLRCKDPLFSRKLVFVGEVATVVILGGRKMPTSPVFNVVNVSVYACAGWPNYPMSSKIFHCNYHSPQ